ncbi:MAG: tetratricopeptide repeat protein [Acidobacteria bacterium]|nr:tetratricopeptide repeat protein [Acidobacteriota bacterium]
MQTTALQMKSKMKSHSTVITLIFLFSSIAVAQIADLPPGVVSEFQPKSATDDAYAAGKKAMYAGEWQQALDSFSQVVKAGGAHADEALYWQAVSQNKLGQPRQSLASIAQFKRQFPRSQWSNDIGALELEVNKQLGVAPKPEKEPDCELKLLAVNSLMNSDPDRAVPIIEKLLNNGGNSGQCGGQVLEKALFVLAQSDSQRAHELMMQIATGKLHPELEQKAIHYIGISGKSDDLMQIYKSSTSLDAKRAALHGLGIGGGCRQLLSVSAEEKNPDLVREAIHSMGIAGCKSEIRDLYNRTTNPDLKRDILHSTIISGDTELQQKVATTDPDPKVRADAVKDLGISGGCSQLSGFSGKETDPEVIRAAIHAMGVGGCKEQLRDLYSHTTNADLKRDILHSTIVSGDTELQEKVALSDPDPNLRSDAIKDLGISGGSSATLMKIYQENPSSEARNAAINALFIKGDAHSLIELARKETNPELKKQIVSKLSIMGNREATDYLMEILNKE